MAWYTGSRRFSIPAAGPRRQRLRAVATVAAAGLVVTLAQVPATATGDTAKATEQAADPVEVAPDAAAAAIAAKAQDSPVEDASARTTYTSTVVNPDGSKTLQVSQRAQHVHQDGEWVDIDPTLSKQDGVLSPAATRAEVAISPEGTAPDMPLAQISRGSKSLALDWPQDLPKADVDGAVATFAAGGTHDVQVTATPEGFNLRVILSEAPATAPVYRLPITAKGVHLVKTPLNAFQAVDSAGTVVFNIDPPVAWDASQDGREGGPEQIVPVQADLVEDADGGQALELRPDFAWLTAQNRTYPVTIDPDVTAAHVRDTDVRELFPSTSFGSSSSLRTGYDTTSGKQRAYLEFGTPSIPSGTHLLSATLKLFQWDAGSCTPTTMNVYPVTETWGTGITWSPTTSQPAYTTSGSYAASASFAHGNGTGCANDYAEVDVTNMVSAWMNGSLANHGMTLRSSETSGTAYKAFCSMNSVGSGSTVCDTASDEPKLYVTYNSYPGTVTGRSTSPTTACKTGSTRPYISSARPTFKGQSGDDDGGKTRIKVEIWPISGSAADVTGYSSYVTQYTTTSWQVPPGSELTNGATYKWHAKGSDGTDLSQDWSSWCEFTVDTTAPAAPTIAASGYTGGGYWFNPAPGSNSFTFSGASDVVSYSYSKDNSAWTTLAAGTGLSWAPTSGAHTLQVKAIDRAGNVSPAATFAFALGAGVLTSPQSEDRTQAYVRLSADSSSSLTHVAYQYRQGNTGTWVTVPTGDVAYPGTTTHPTWPMAKTGSPAAFAGLDWNLGKTVHDAGGGDGLVQVRACLYTSATDPSPACTVSTDVTLEASAFDASYASEEVGPGSVSLATGDYSVGGTDVAIGDLGVGRTHTTLAPTTNTAGAQGVFGPGWTASLPSGGGSQFTINDQVAKGFVVLQGPDGTARTYTTTSTAYPYAFTGIGATADGSTMEKTNATTYKLTDAAKTVTTWTYANSRWNVTSVNQPGAGNATTFTYDSSGRVTQALAPVPAGVSCNTLVAGCRALTFAYATATDSGLSDTVWGDYTGRLSTVSFTGYDPDTSAMATVAVARYSYDNTGHLRAAWDPRTSPALKTTYSYNTAGRVATLTPPGLVPYELAYDTVGRLAHVRRVDPANGAAVQAVAYDLPITGSGSPIDMSNAASWAQNGDLPRVGTAIFPASHVPSRDSGTGIYTPGSSDWSYASLIYLDVNGRDVDDASYGAGAWQINSVQYDDAGRPTWQLTAENRAQALAPNTSTDPYVAGLTDSASRADLLASRTTYDSNGNVKSALGPAHLVVLASGDSASARAQTTTTYDEGAPSGGPFGLATTITTAPLVLDGTPTTAADTTTTLTGYAPIDGKSLTDATSGWTLYLPTTATQVVAGGGTDIVRRIRYDDTGRVVESRMPASDGTDAGTTLAVYYTTAANSTYPTCGGKAYWAGMVCQTLPAAGTTLPTTRFTYDMYGRPVTTTETVGTTVRTTATTYAGARTQTTGTTVTPAADGGQTVPQISYTYDSGTGLPTAQTAGGATVTAAYDTLGQLTSYTDADSSTSTFTYTLDGQVKTLNDGKGTYTYTYDGTDAAGNTERRGLPTAMTAGFGGSTPAAFAGAYNGDGALVRQDYPNGLTATTTYDNDSAASRLTYAKSGTSWMDFSANRDLNGRVRTQASPVSSQIYNYDGAGRLGQVQDTYANACTTRIYTFTTNSNRKGLGSYGPAAACSGGTPADSFTYDTIDRATTSGYTYDTFGRTTTVPASQTTTGNQVTVAYHVNDMVRSITEGSRTKTYTLDPTSRIRSISDTTSATLTNHYADTGDAPAWITDGTNWTRNVIGLDQQLVATQASGGAVTLNLANLHGDIVATVADDTAATGIDTYSENTEYGLARSSSTARYSWLGGDRRSNDAVGGLVLMGVRLYNPATGRFLSVDPVSGGSANAYEYCNGDPINCRDLDGRLAWFPHRGHINFYFSQGEVRSYIRLASVEGIAFFGAWLGEKLKEILPKHFKWVAKLVKKAETAFLIPAFVAVVTAFIGDMTLHYAEKKFEEGLSVKVRVNYWRWGRPVNAVASWYEV